MVTIVCIGFSRKYTTLTAKEFEIMGFYSDIKKVFVSTFDVLADKTSTQAQKSRLVTVMKNEEKIADRAYIALGKYLYSTLREGMPEDVEQLCSVIDASKERMTRAQEIYREVIQKEKVNSEISRTELKENIRKVKEPIVAGAADTAAKASAIVKDTVSDTAAKAEELKAAAAARAEARKNPPKNEPLTDEELESPDPIEESGEYEDIFVAAQEEPVVEAASAEVETAPPVESVADESAEPESEPQTEEEAHIPMDVFSEEEFEENEAIVKPIDRKPLAKAKRLKDIITKKDEQN